MFRLILSHSFYSCVPFVFFSVCHKGEINIGLYIRLLCRQCLIYAFSTVSRHVYTRGFALVEDETKNRPLQTHRSWPSVYLKRTDRVVVWWSVPRGPKEPAIIWGPHKRHLANTLNYPCFATMRAVATITVTTCLTGYLLVTSGVYM